MSKFPLLQWSEEVPKAYPEASCSSAPAGSVSGFREGIFSTLEEADEDSTVDQTVGNATEDHVSVVASVCQNEDGLWRSVSRARRRPRERDQRGKPCIRRGTR